MTEDLQAFENDLESLADGTRSLQEAAARNLEYIGQHAERARDTIRKLRKEVDTFFDDLEQKISDKVTKIQNEDEDKISFLSKQCESLAKQIKDLKADTADKERTNQKCRLFEDVQELQGTLEKQMIDISTMEKTNTVRDSTFRPWVTTSNLISDQSVEFGSLVGFCQTVPVLITSSSESDSYITSIAVLSGGRVAVINARNDCVKVIDTTRDRLITSMALPEDSGYYIGITTVSDNDIALLYDGEIKLYSVTDQFNLTKTISASLLGWGFVYTNNYFIGFTGPLEPTLCMVKMNGDVVKTFPTQIDGEDLFIYPWYIGVNPDQTAIYVSDLGNETVTCLTFDGEVKSRYKYSSEWLPFGIAVSREGLVYVCDSDSYNIHILTSDLEEAGQIIGEKYNMLGPWGLCYRAKKHKLYVGSRNSLVRVFNI